MRFSYRYDWSEALQCSVRNVIAEMRRTEGEEGDRLADIVQAIFLDKVPAEQLVMTRPDGGWDRKNYTLFRKAMFLFGELVEDLKGALLDLQRLAEAHRRLVP